MKAARVEKVVVKAAKPEGFDNDWQPVRVLVVDDEMIVRKLLTQVLRSAGYEVVGEAEDGRRAVEMYRRLKPELVTLDVEMPVMDGLTALQEILAKDPKAKVVMLTSHVEKELVTKIIGAGARDYIVKPIDRSLILLKLRKIRGIP